MTIQDELALAICKAQCNGGRPSGIDYAAADAILARYGVVELPEPVLSDGGDLDEDDDPYEFRAPWGTYYAVCGTVESDSGPAWRPEHARLEAAALLAAANRAETQS